jgi:lipoyl-dependent peroxiredoxin
MKPFLNRNATTKGGRNGKISDTQSGLELTLAKPVEMGGEPSSHTNPEELFSMGYSACFASSIEYLLISNKESYEDISVEADTALVPDGEAGFKFAVTIKAKITGLSKEKESNYIEQAYNFCPYSKAIKGNVEVNFK